MTQATEPKRHYKMYKQGKFWLFAGMTTLTWQVGMVAQADTPVTTANTESTTVSTTATPSKSVTLSGSTAENVSGDENTVSDVDTTSSVAADSSAPSTESTASDASSTADSTTSEATTSASSDADSATSEATSNAVSADESSNESAASSTVTVGDEVSVSADQSAPSQSSQSSQSTETTDVASSTATSAAAQVTNTVNKPAAASTTVTPRATRAMATPKATSVDVVDYPGYHLTTNLSSGIFGTSEWWIDEDNVLHIGAGTLAATKGVPEGDLFINDKNDIPWFVDIGSEDDDEGNSQITKVIFEGPVVADADASALFYGLVKATQIEGLALLDTSHVVNMRAMFGGTWRLSTLDLSNFDTHNVTDMGLMFGEYGQKSESLVTLDVSNFDTSNVTDMLSMFQEVGLTELDLSNFDTSKVTTMLMMFTQCQNLTTLNVSSFDTSNVKEVFGIFTYCAKLTSLDLGSWDLSNLGDGVTSEDYFRVISRALEGLDGAKTLRLNKNAVLMFGGFDAGLSDPPTDSTYTGKWRNTKTQQSYTSDELMNLYNGDGAVDETYTYVWETWLSTEDSTLYTGPKTTWEPADNLSDSSSLTLADGVAYQITDNAGKTYTTVPVNTPGVYTITYTGSFDGSQYQSSATVTVKASQAAITVTDSFVHAGESWQPTQGVTKVVAADGQTLVDASELTVVGTVDTSKVGKYQVTYQWVDQAGNVIESAPATVNVAGIDVHDQQVAATTDKQWSPADNFTSGLATDGTLITLANVQVTGTADYATPGTYSIKYQYTGTDGNQVTATAIVTVTDNQSQLVLKPKVTLIQGPTAKWQAEDGFVSATDTDGTAISFDQLTTTGTVDLTTAGDYKVTYHYTNSAGTSISETLTVTVQASQAAIKAHDSTQQVTTQGKWQPTDNLDTVTDAYGQPVTDTTSVTTTGTVDLSQAGDYPVTYSYTDVSGNVRTKTITVTVTTSAAQINVSAGSTLVAGPKTTWQASDNWVSATNSDGSDVPLSAVTVKGQVDTATPGDYEVTYQFTALTGELVSRTITVHVQATKASLQVQDATYDVTTQKTWSPADQVVHLTDAQGQTIDYADANITTSGTVDLSQPGTYVVAYSYTDAQGNLIPLQTVTITVVAPTTGGGDNGGDGDNGSDGGDQNEVDPDDQNNGSGDTDTTDETANGDGQDAELDQQPNRETTSEPTDVDDPSSTPAASGTSTGQAAAKIQPAALSSRSTTSATQSKRGSLAQLPQTGETSNHKTAWAGGLLLAASGLLAGLGLAKPRRKDE